MPGDAAKIKVLIVDDHKMFADSLARLLGDEDDIAVVGVVDTAPAAIDLVRRERPNVALIDYQMPERDGVEVATDLRGVDDDLKTVMLTGTNEDRVLLAAIEAGCSGFLTKDRAASEVVDAVHAAAAGEALIPPALLSRLLPKLSRSYRHAGEDLTDRERGVLAALARGASNSAIAGELHLSVHTVRNYVQSILNKLGAHSKLEAVSIAVREGVIDYPTSS